jgi:hypothetical protein
MKRRSLQAQLDETLAANRLSKQIGEFKSKKQNDLKSQTGCTQRNFKKELSEQLNNVADALQEILT